MQNGLRIGLLTFVYFFAPGCQPDASPPPDAGTNQLPDVGPDDTDAGDDVASAICDTDCLADRLVALYRMPDPGCRCDGLGVPSLDQGRIDDCERERVRAEQEFVSPRECVARYFTDPRLQAELGEWIQCREERIRTRGPCIMALQDGDSCDDCPEFWEDGGDPCESPDTASNEFERCYAQMVGSRWEQ